jgi:hypothetical protein
MFGSMPSFAAAGESVMFGSSPREVISVLMPIDIGEVIHFLLINSSTAAQLRF